MGMSKEAWMKLQRATSSATGMVVSKKAVMVNRDLIYMAEDGLKVVTPVRTGVFGRAPKPDTKQGIYKIACTRWVSWSHTKKRGKFRKGFFTVRGWHLAYKLAKKHDTQMVRIG